MKNIHQIVDSTVAGARDKTQRSWLSIGFAAVLAGVYIAMGGVLSVLVGYGFPVLESNSPIASRLLSGAFFPLGIILVVFLGAELFTGNNATLIPSTLRGAIPRGYFLKNWGVVYLGNFIGALFFVYFFVHLTGLLAVSPWREAIVGVAEKKVALPFAEAFLRGIGANWFVCLAVWLSLSSESAMGRMLGLWMPVMAFVVMGFEHSIANMFFIPAGMFEGASVTVGQFLLNNLVPVTLGNIVGGALFVGAAYSWLTRQPKPRAS